MLFYWQITLDVFCLSSAQRTASGNPNMSLLNVHHTHHTIWIHLAYYNSSRPYHSHTLTLFLSLSTFQLPCIAYVMYKCLANSIVFFFICVPGPDSHQHLIRFNYHPLVPESTGHDRACGMIFTTAPQTTFINSLPFAIYEYNGHETQRESCPSA